MKLKTINLIKHNKKRVSEETTNAINLHVRQSMPTSMPIGKPTLRISLSKPLKVLNAYN